MDSVPFFSGGEWGGGGANIRLIFQQQRTLIGLHPNALEYLSTLGHGELARIIYRDHVQIKHGSRKRLATEVESKMRVAEQTCSVDPDALLLVDKAADAPDLMSKMLIAYLREVTWIKSCPSLRLQAQVGPVYFMNVRLQTPDQATHQFTFALG